MPTTFAEWEAARKGQTTAPSSEQVDTSVPMHHPSAFESPTEAFMGELGRTGIKAATGLAKSPLALLSGLLHPIESLKGMGEAVAHPLDTIKAIGDDPEAGGSLLGQVLLGKVLPGAAGSALEHGPGMVGRGMGSVGRGMERVGTSAPARTAGGFGAMEAAMRLDPKGLAVAAAPAALEYGGRGLQRIGSSIENLKPMDSLRGLKDSLLSSPVEEALTPEAETVRQTVGTAKDYLDKGMSRAQAGQRAGWPLGQSTEVGESVPAPHAGKWATGPRGSGPEPTPIERFNLENPPSDFRRGGPRSTGSFEEGPGGLSHLDEMTPHENPPSGITQEDAIDLNKELQALSDLSMRKGHTTNKAGRRFLPE